MIFLSNRIFFLPTAILLVTSYVGHDQVRSAHRAAISGNDLDKLNIVRVFLLADIPLKEKFITQKAIQNENDHFNDIVQGALHHHLAFNQFSSNFHFNFQGTFMNHTETCRINT